MLRLTMGSVLPRGALRKRGTSLSVTLVYCFKTAKDIIIYFSHSDSPIILVSEAKAPLPNSK